MKRGDVKITYDPEMGVYSIYDPIKYSDVYDVVYKGLIEYLESIGITEDKFLDDFFSELIENHIVVFERKAGIGVSLTPSRVKTEYRTDLPNISRYRIDWEGNTKWFKELGKKIIDRINSKLRIYKSRQDRLKKNLIISMQARDIETAETELGKIRLQQSESVRNLPLSEYPEIYIKTRVIEEIDKVKLKKDCKDNPELAEKFIERKPFIKIY